MRTFTIIHSAVVRARYLARHLRRADVRQRIRLAAQRYDTNVLRILTRIFKLYALDRYVPNESLIYGLVNPAVPLSERRMHFSEERLHGYQAAINSPESGICRDKLAFHSYCHERNLPVAQVYALISPLGSHSTHRGSLRTPDQWADLVESQLPDCVIIKPRSGRQGRSIRRFRKTDGSLLAAFQALEADCEDWLVQDCLRPHDAVAALTGTDALSSLRIFTLMNEHNVPEIMDAGFQLITGNSITGNISDYASGRLSGNVVATPDLETGIIRRAWRANPDGVGYEWLSEHPDTGREVVGFQVPEWGAVVDLVHRAAGAFLPIRTAGWDVAITNVGPVLIEVNERFQHSSIGPATDQFRRALAEEANRLAERIACIRKRHYEEQT